MENTAFGKSSFWGFMLNLMVYMSSIVSYGIAKAQAEAEEHHDHRCGAADWIPLKLNHKP